VGRLRLDPTGSGEGPVAGCFEHGNGPLGSVKVQAIFLIT
jgi:hypothetical protein